MAKFGKPPGAKTTGYDSSANAQFTRAGVTYPFGLWDGDALLVDSADPSIATIVETTNQSGMRAFDVTGGSPGRTTLEAKDGSGAVQASVTIQVNAKLTYDEVFADFQITDEDRRNLPPDAIARLLQWAKEMREKPPPDVDLSSERFSDNVLVKVGETHPPDWSKKS